MLHRPSILGEDQSATESGVVRETDAGTTRAPGHAGPSPLPRVFGYHEVFHTLVALGCAVLYTVVFVDVLPR